MATPSDHYSEYNATTLREMYKARNGGRTFPGNKAEHVIELQRLDAEAANLGAPRAPTRHKWLRSSIQVGLCTVAALVAARVASLLLAQYRPASAVAANRLASVEWGTWAVIAAVWLICLLDMLRKPSLVYSIVLPFQVTDLPLYHSCEPHVPFALADAPSLCVAVDPPTPNPDDPMPPLQKAVTYETSSSSDDANVSMDREVVVELPAPQCTEETIADVKQGGSPTPSRDASAAEQMEIDLAEAAGGAEEEPDQERTERTRKGPLLNSGLVEVRAAMERSLRDADDKHARREEELQGKLASVEAEFRRERTATLAKHKLEKDQLAAEIESRPTFAEMEHYAYDPQRYSQPDDHNGTATLTCFLSDMQAFCDNRTETSGRQVPPFYYDRHTAPHNLRHVPYTELNRLKRQSLPHERPHTSMVSRNSLRGGDGAALAQQCAVPRDAQLHTGGGTGSVPSSAAPERKTLCGEVRTLQAQLRMATAAHQGCGDALKKAAAKSLALSKKAAALEGELLEANEAHRDCGASATQAHVRHSALEAEVKRHAAEGSRLRWECDVLTADVRHLQDAYYQSTAQYQSRTRRRHIVRVRPETAQELAGALALVDLQVSMFPPEIRLQDGGQPRSWSFHHVLDWNNSNRELFRLFQPMVEAGLRGRKVLLAADGPSGGGKTYSLLESDQALIPQAIQWIFRGLQARDGALTVRFQAMEIEVGTQAIHDLLVPHKPGQLHRDLVVEVAPASLAGREVKCYRAAGLQTCTPQTVEELTEQIHRVFGRRKTAKSQRNEVSSQSHLICSIHICNKQADDRRWPEIRIVDLVGSEEVGGESREHRDIAAARMAFREGVRASETWHLRHKLVDMLTDCLADPEAIIGTLTCVNRLAAHIKKTKASLSECQIDTRGRHRNAYSSKGPPAPPPA
ncbi:kinesin-like nuclear fusion protein [Friedmanniomyces endolithicus]|nr:kinesin-like nuclear fusion protein [Friedmanniomyces endolithicus]